MQVDGLFTKGFASTVCLKDSSVLFRASAARDTRRTSQPGPVLRTFAAHLKSLSFASATSPRATVGQTLFCKDRSRPPQRASAVRAGVDSPTQNLDRNLHKKCLQAAVHLQERGWAVVEDVLTQQECEEYIASLWDWLEALGTGIQRKDPNTWTPEKWPPTYRGILNSLEIAHQSFVWQVRKHERIRKVFELLLGTNELLTSFDAINVLAPHNEAPPPGWLHVDQTPLRPHFACLQGLVNLVDVSAETSGTLMVKDKSHRAHQDFFHAVSQLTSEQLAAIPDHYQFTTEQLPYWEQFETVRLQGRAGSLFLWDSRTTHSNTYPAKIESWRHVVYTCYQPRSMASSHDLQLKAQAWREHQITTHLPAENIRVYDDNFAKSQPGAVWPNEAKVLDTHQPSYTITRDRHLVEDSVVRSIDTYLHWHLESSASPGGIRADKIPPVFTKLEMTLPLRLPLGSTRGRVCQQLSQIMTLRPRLAGVEEYPRSKITAQESWIDTPVTQLQDALQQL